jgi:phosphatidylglycerol---prolipoprotein diacylglyceryl transferase
MESIGLPFPAFDPIAFTLIGKFTVFGTELGPVVVRWYGLAYLAGLTLGWLYMRRLVADAHLWRGGVSPMTRDQADDFLLWATLGTVLGGRIGFFLLYEPTALLHNPMIFFVIWHGGMAFHGGFLGVLLAVALFSRLNRIPFLSLGDLCAAVVPFGLFFGRIANFINGEIYGRLTTAPWAVNFPPSVLSPGDLPGPRHPTQIYEAFLEGIVMFVVLRYFTHSRLALRHPGLTSGVFICGYALARITVEFFKEWDVNQFFTTAYFSEGMVYSLPMLAFGVYLITRATKKQLLPA